MRIGIVGAGRLGGALAGHCTTAGHQVVIADSRAPDMLGRLVARLGPAARAVPAGDLARLGELVVVAVPFHRYAEMPTAGLAGKTVIDTTNHLPTVDGPCPELDEDRTTSSELVQAHLRDALLVKAFNTMRWEHLRDYGREAGALQRYGMPLAGNNHAAKRAVEALVEQFGFEPVDAGDLPHGGRKLQPGGPAYLADLPGPALRERLGPPAYR